MPMSCWGTRWLPGLTILASLGAALSAKRPHSAGTSTGFASGADRKRAATIDEMFARWDNPDSPGYAIGIIRDGKLILARGYGMANLDDSVPITPRTVFEVG